LYQTKLKKSVLKQMGFIPHGDIYIPKGDVPNEEFEDDQEMLEVALVVGSSSAVVGTSFSMEENIANICRRMEERYNLQGTRHE